MAGPGCWALFCSHLDPEETPEQGLQRELVMVHHIHRRTAHVFRGELSVPLGRLQLLEGQGMALVSSEELLSGLIWSTKLGSHRSLADGLLDVMQHVLTR
ncbi:MAG: hypothetical protein K0U63_00025 [Cyanobacteria bacterium]|nr:hypothetical protein [Cyanobacteriota bacterium]